jgi:hypothetical protein
MSNLKAQKLKGTSFICHKKFLLNDWSSLSRPFKIPSPKKANAFHNNSVGNPLFVS